jgi:alkyl sulfatase BDS1-like metallo-beta-lactamase superfamily hydrolase
MHITKVSKLFSYILLVCLGLSNSLAQDSDNLSKLRGHSDEFRQEVIQVTDGIYVAVGYALANVIMIEGDDGLLIVDTTESVAAAQQIKAEFDKISNKPVKAIVYTHSHPDHVGGARIFAGDDNPEVYSHEKALRENLPATAGRAGRGGADQFGIRLTDDQRLNAGIGSKLVFSGGGIGSGYIAPTQTFAGERMQFEVAGISVELVYAPGETDDQIYVWLPEQEALMPGDNFYRAFPNIVAIRGVPLRRADHWYESLAKMIAEQPTYLVPSHTRPILGTENVNSALTAYHDGVKSVYDQTIAGMNQGLRPDELVEIVKLPPELADNPYLQEFYGTVPWAVRVIYSFHLGWFDGNATNLFPLSNKDRAQRLIELSGGEGTVLAAAQLALSDNEYQWAAELADYVLLVTEDNREALLIKASALRALGSQQVSANARNWYLTSAIALEAAAMP